MIFILYIIFFSNDSEKDNIYGNDWYSKTKAIV